MILLGQWILDWVSCNYSVIIEEKILELQQAVDIRHEELQHAKEASVQSAGAALPNRFELSIDVLLDFQSRATKFSLVSHTLTCILTETFTIFLLNDLPHVIVVLNDFSGQILVGASHII